MLASNLQEVERKIMEACDKAGRAREEITLIAVSKTKPVPMLQEIYDLGVRDFGENKVQELTDKEPQLPADLRWHMIGHLQRNKVKQVIDKAVLIHSVDSVRLAKAIEAEAAKKDIIVQILLEVNVAEEDSKFGLKLDEVLPAVEEIATMPHVRIKGLMTIAPFVENPEENRTVFAQLQKLSVDIAKKNIDNVSVDILSMGMSSDYETAIKHGSNLVRIGTKLFGARKYLEV